MHSAHSTRLEKLDQEVAPLLSVLFGGSENSVWYCKGGTSMPLQALSRAVSSSGRFSESPIPWMVEGGERDDSSPSCCPEGLSLQNLRFDDDPKWIASR
jgi:hypothetical protein